MARFLARLYLGFTFLLKRVLNVLSFSRMTPINRWCSVAASAPLKLLTSNKEDIHLRLIVIWSNCAKVFLSGDTQIVLWISLCGKREPPITRSWLAQKSTSISPFVFLTPGACFPKMWLILVLSLPTLCNIQVTRDYCNIASVHFFHSRIKLAKNSSFSSAVDVSVGS